MTARSEVPRSLPLVVLVLLIGIVVVRAPIVAGGETWADLRYHTEIAPPRLAAAELVQSGALPLWWEGSGLGVPLAAEASHGALYPPLWIASSPRLFDLVAIAHLVWAALGIALWSRRRNASEPAAVAAGLLVATSGVLASATIRGALPALAHLPWVGICAAGLASAQSARSEPRIVARAAIGLALSLGAIALAGVFAIAIDAIVLAIVIAARRRTWPQLAGAIAAGVAIGCAQWWPAILHAGELAGSGELYGLPLSRLVELIVPASFGAGDDTRGVASIAGATPWAPSLFVGAPLLALAAVRPPTVRGIASVLFLATLSLVAGRGGWPAWIGAPELHVAALAIVLGPHAAAGFDAFVAGERRAVLSLGVGAACAGVALGAVLAQKARYPDAASAIDRALLDGGLGLVCIVLAIALGWRASRTRLAPVARGQVAIALALLVLPTVGATPSIAPTMDRAAVEDPPPFAAAALARPEQDEAPRRVFRPQYMFAFEDDRENVETTADALATFSGASGWRWGIAAARSEDPARSPLHDRFWLAAANEGGALLDRFGIALAILPETVIVPRKLAPLARRGKWALVELPVAPPAAVLHGALFSLDPDDTMALMYPGGGGIGVLPGTTVLRTRGDGRRRPDRGPPRACPIESWEPGAIDVSCTADVPAYAVVSSSAAPGWHVTVDGEPASWHVADVLRRAVEIPAGTHRIEWRYRTPGLFTGALVAIVALLGLLAVAITTRNSRPPPRDRARDEAAGN